MNSSPCILPFDGQLPKVHESCWLAPNATLVGAVRIERDASVWFQAVLRGDVAPIHIGEAVNIQDGAIVHATRNHSSTFIAAGASIGHNAIIHGAHIGEGALIGMGAIILDNASVGKRSVVAAGAVVLEGTEIPAGELWAGVPAQSKGPVSPDLAKVAAETAAHYQTYADGLRSVSRQIGRADNATSSPKN